MPRVILSGNVKSTSRRPRTFLFQMESPSFPALKELKVNNREGSRMQRALETMNMLILFEPAYSGPPIPPHAPPLFYPV